MAKNYITAQGADKLKKELHDLLHQQRPDLVKVVAWAASNGDRSENGDYIYGKRKLREIDRKIRFLTKRLESAEVVDPKLQPRGKVLFGSRVLVIDEDGNTRDFRIVGTDEIDPKRGWISWVSPAAKALLGHKVGDLVQVQTPNGMQEWEISEIFVE